MTRSDRAVAAVPVAPPTSLFEVVDLPMLATATRGGRGPGAAALAVRRHDAVTGRDGPRPDVVVLGGRFFGRPEPGWAVRAEGLALAVAYGAAMARRTHHRNRGPGQGAWVWCVLRAEALDDGRTWEAARAAAAQRLDTLTAVVTTPVGRARDVTRVFEAAGWCSIRCAAADPLEILRAVDHLRAGHGRPGALVAGSE